MTQFLHIISVYKQNTSWTKNLIGPYQFYYKNTPAREPYNNVNICGAETNVLKFIIDFYDNLPDVCVFTHPYNNKWTHSGTLYDHINKLYNNRDNLLTFGPISKCTPRYSIKTNRLIKYDFMKETGWWDETMKDYFGEMPLNFSLGKISSAQFYVNKNTIQRLPITFYKNMYAFLIEKSNANSLYKRSSPYNQFWTSRFMEWSWEFIFTADMISISPPSS
jgi:hypothetical protein